LLMSKAKLRAHDLKPHQVTLCVKEVIGFPRETIESRFNLEGDQGLAVQMLGGVTKGLTGMGFLYTNRDAGAGGRGGGLTDLVSSLGKPYELLEHLKAHPRVRPLIAGGETLEYTAHMIPAGGFPEMPRLAGDGVLAVGDAGMLVNSVSWEGANFAMESGRLAGETVVEAKQAGDFSARTLGRYQGRLEASFVLKDLRHFGNTIPYVETHPHFFGVYPGMAVAAAEEFFTVDGVPKKEKERKILRAVHARRPVWRIVWDLVRAWGSLR
ncbi:MAG: FAD-dependent oxidoreductase, partial [bacterium]